MLSPAEYEAAKVICDRAEAYAQQFVKPNGWIILTAEQAAEPIYAACTNELRGAVEEFELCCDRPDRFVAYEAGFTVATWTGIEVGKIILRTQWYRDNFGGRWRGIRVLSAWGDRYYGREYDSMQLIRLRKVMGNAAK